jgi:hypothetical protein
MSGATARYSAVAVVLLALTGAPHGSAVGVFDRFAPDLVLGRGDRERLDRGTPVVRVAAGKDGVLVLAAAIGVDVTAERLLAWSASVEAMQKGRYVPEIGRFSSPPRLEDLDGLVVDADDLRDLARCRPGNCGLKLSDAEMAALDGVREKAALDAVLRGQLLRRASDYLGQGDACALAYHDHNDPVFPSERFGALLQRLPFMARDLPCYAEYLSAYPAVPTDGHVQQSFLYWSKETLGMKPIISITHFTAARFDSPGLPEAVVVARQVHATHYKDASVTVTVLVAENGRRYLVYLNRSAVDAFHGFFGGMVRRMVEHRVKAEAPAVLRGLRARLESGEPPGPLRFQSSALGDQR